MEGRLVLTGCSVFRADGRVRADMSVLVEGRTITKVAPSSELHVLPGDWEVSCRGRLVTPGLVDCHTHLVGGQLVPLAGEWLLKPFAERFAHRYHLESVLTPGEVQALTAWALARGLRNGVTMFVEHLHAPSDVAKSLAAQAQVAERLGARLVNSHASSTYLKPEAGYAQLEANAEYVAQRRRHGLVRGAVGLCASFCCDDDLLQAAGRACEQTAAGAVFHLGECEDDVTITWQKYGRRVVQRFEQHGLLNPTSVAAYAGLVDRNESMRLARSRTLLALSPRASQATEGLPGTSETVLAFANLVGLGTAGDGTLWEEAACAFNAVVGVARHGRLLDPDGHLANLLVGGPAELCSMIWGTPCGTVEEGSLADLVVFDHVPAAESPAGGAPHLLQQLSQSPAAWTIVDGRVTVREGQLLGVDSVELARDAAKALEAVWARTS